MTYQVEILPQALAEIEDAYHSIESNIAPALAIKWYDELVCAVKSLQEMPARCPLAPEGREFERETRQLLVGKKRTYRVLFTVEGSTVYILHVRHTKQARLSEDALGRESIEQSSGEDDEESD